MTQQQPQHPITYGDVFEHVGGELASQPITIEDASVMQSAETVGFGKAQKGGAASLMQAAANNNVNAGAVDRKAHSNAAEEGFTLMETIIDGEVHREELVGDQSLVDSTTFVPTLPDAAATKGVTIGEALEGAALTAGDKLVDYDTARAIQSAEARATGAPVAFRGGVGATAQSAAEKNVKGEHHTVSEVLDDATEKMVVDKVVTQEDVEKVKHAEMRTSGEKGIITPALQAAVNLNASAYLYIDAQQQQDLLNNPLLLQLGLGSS